MTKRRRNEVGKISRQLVKLLDELALLIGQEQAAYERMSEARRNSTKGEQIVSVLDDLDYAHGNIEDAINSLSSALKE